MLLAFSPYCAVYAAEITIDCRLKGGTVVQLPAQACMMEGGAPVNVAATPTLPATAVVPQSTDGNSAEVKSSSADIASRAAWTESQKVIIDLLGKPVMDTTPLKRNPEGIERAAKFDGCKLIVDEILRIEYGNLFSTWKNFKISSVIDLDKIDREEFGMLGKIASKGGDLKASAVYFEELKRKGGNNISISVDEPRNGGYEKYKTHGPSAFWDAPRDDLWIVDEYGYPKDNGFGNAVKDKIRILLIVNSSDDAEKLKKALEEVNAECKKQPN
jgi:hypothetical protein